MHSQMTKIHIAVIIVQVNIMYANKVVLIGALGKIQHSAWIVHLLGQLPELNNHNSNKGAGNVDGADGVAGADGGGKARIGGDDSDKDSNF
jgi:hypothetical protein